MLKSLDLAGFKSFARPTHLEFPPGITAIVGPNGSGKSNVVDGIRWCLGEQSSRELRGTRAEDVIYAGRKRTLGAADVSMLLADASGADIEVGRRLFRSGESEYLVNRRRVRLRDVVIALAGIGIDAGRHVVVNQGMADALLSAGPQERRGLLEQAAGLSRYREQRDEARHKIAATQASIETIHVVLGEMEPRLALLGRQAKAVADRQQLADRLTERLGLWYAHRWAIACDAVKVAREDSARAKVELEGARVELRALETKIDDILAEERRIVQQRESAVAALHQSERECDDVRRSRDAVRQRLTEMNERLEEAKLRRIGLEEAVESGQAERAEAEAVLEELDREIENCIERRDVSHIAVERSREAASRAAKAAGDVRDKLTHLAQRHGAAIDAHRSASLALESRAADRARLIEQRAALDVRHSALERELADATGRLGALEREVHEAERRVAALHLDRDRCLVRMRRVADTQRGLEASLGRARGEIEAARRRQGAAADGVNSDLLAGMTIPAGWEKAIAAALGEQARAGRLEIAEVELIAFRTWRKSLCLTGIWADEFVGGAQPALLAGTLLVEEDDEARAVWGSICDRDAHLIGSPPMRVVARSGLVYEPGGSRISSRGAAPEDYLRDRAETERWEQRGAELGRRISVLRVHDGSLAERLASIEDDLRDAERHFHAGRESLSVAKGTKDALAKQVATEVDEACTSRAELERTERDGVIWADRAAIAEQDAYSLAAEVAAVQQQYDHASLEAEEARRRLEQGRTDHDAHCRALVIAEERRIDREAMSNAAARALSRVQSDLDQTITAVSVLETQIDRARLEGEQLVIALNAIGERIRDQRVRLEALPRVLEAERPDPRHLRELVVEATSRFERASARVERADDDAARLRMEIQLDLAIGPGELPVPAGEIPEEGEIRRLKSRVASQASLDDAVIGEYEELNERHTYLSHHLDDLDQALRELNEILAVSDREMETRFATAFEAVDAEFGRVFEIMLRGGRGRLTQTNDGGVDIIAELPGKRSRLTTAYSGGERALLATALLFAVLKIRPTPFCVLDEVDAALDESNVDRYLAVLRDISTSTQTIVVTHNRATMAAADVLYGMTMDGEGGTNVLSLNLQTYSAS